MRKRIYPTPKSVIYNEGVFAFGKDMNLRRSREFDDAGKLSMLCELWNSFTGTAGELHIEEDTSLPANTFVFGDTQEMIQEVADNDYCLRIVPNGIIIRAKETSGLYFGFYTLLQMIKLKSLKEGQEYIYVDCAEIEDKAAIQFRSIHFSITPGVSLLLIKKQMRMAAMMKFTHIILEFWASLKLDALPELAWSNGYTKEEVRPIFEEARNLGLEIIPMFNHLGHASGEGPMQGKHVVLDQNPRLAPLFEPTGWTFCISNPETKEILRKIRKEMLSLCGEGSYFCIGLDEAYDFASCDDCSKTPKEQLLADFVNEIQDEMTALGRRVMVWADMLLYDKKFNKNKITDTTTAGLLKQNYLVAHATDETPTHKALDLINKEVIMLDWQYYHREGTVATAAHLVERGYDTIVASWLDFENIKHLCYETEKENYFGYMSTVWGVIDRYPELILFSGEAAWYGKKAETIDSFRHEIRFCDTGTMQRKLVPNCTTRDMAGLTVAARVL